MSADAPVEVTVVVATFDHESSIERALHSVLTQRTERSLEVIVSEDCSTDATRDLVLRAARCDERVRVMLSEHNLASNEVVARAIGAARGRYLCLLDGDDWWCSPDKVERQAAFLDEHPEASAVFHNAVIAYDDLVTDERWTPATQPRHTDARRIWEGNPFATCAGMMRTGALHGLGAWYHDLFPITDWPLYVLCARYGLLCFDDDVVGVYRLHAGGEFSALPRDAKLDAIAGFYAAMRRSAGGHDPDLDAGAARYFFDQAWQHVHLGERDLARRCVRHGIEQGRSRALRKELVRLGGRLWRR